MSQPPNHPEHDPQWDPQSGSADPSHSSAGQSAPGAVGPEGQANQPDGWTDQAATGPDGQPYSSRPVGPDGQPYNGPVGPDGQPHNGPVGPDGQPHNGPVGPDGQPHNRPVGPDGQPQPGYSSAAPEKPKSNPFGIKKLLSALLVLILLGVAAYFIWGNQQKSAALTVGNCIVPSGEQNNLDVKVVDCADDSIYSEYVGEVFDGAGTCTDEGAVPYALGAEDAGPDKATKTGCVIPQLFEGKCYNVTEDTQNIELANCDNAQIRVTKVVEESEASCDAGAEPVSYIKPARTYCVAFSE